MLELEVARDAYTVHVRPELVVEIAFNDIQESPHYPGGLALRFARVKRYRPDKTRGGGRHASRPSSRSIKQMTGLTRPSDEVMMVGSLVEFAYGGPYGDR